MPRPLPSPRPTCLLKNATRFDGKSQQSYDDDNDDDDDDDDGYGDDNDDDNAAAADDDDDVADMVYEVLLL